MKVEETGDLGCDTTILDFEVCRRISGERGYETSVKDTTEKSPGSNDVLTLRTRSLIGDDLWKH